MPLHEPTKQLQRASITRCTFTVRVKEDEDISHSQRRAVLASTHHSNALLKVYESNNRQQRHIVIELLLQFN